MSEVPSPRKRKKHRVEEEQKGIMYMNNVYEMRTEGGSFEGHKERYGDAGMNKNNNYM